MSYLVKVEHLQRVDPGGPVAEHKRFCGKHGKPLDCFFLNGLNSEDMYYAACFGADHNASGFMKTLCNQLRRCSDLPKRYDDVLGMLLTRHLGFFEAVAMVRRLSASKQPSPAEQAFRCLFRWILSDLDLNMVHQLQGYFYYFCEADTDLPQSTLKQSLRVAMADWFKTYGD